MAFSRAFSKKSSAPAFAQQRKESNDPNQENIFPFKFKQTLGRGLEKI
jgi:hypothetical protein